MTITKGPQDKYGVEHMKTGISYPKGKIGFRDVVIKKELKLELSSSS